MNSANFPPLGVSGLPSAPPAIQQHGVEKRLNLSFTHYENLYLMHLNTTIQLLLNKNIDLFLLNINDKAQKSFDEFSNKFSTLNFKKEDLQVNILATSIAKKIREFVTNKLCVENKNILEEQNQQNETMKLQNNYQGILLTREEAHVFVNAAQDAIRYYLELAKFKNKQQ